MITLFVNVFIAKISFFHRFYICNKELPREVPIYGEERATVLSRLNQ